MKANTTSRREVDTGYETSTFALGIGISAAAMVGLWACVCMVSALMNNGIVEVTKGLLGAIY